MTIQGEICIKIAFAERHVLSNMSKNCPHLKMNCPIKMRFAHIKNYIVKSRLKLSLIKIPCKISMKMPSIVINVHKLLCLLNQHLVFTTLWNVCEVWHLVSLLCQVWPIFLGWWPNIWTSSMVILRNSAIQHPLAE